MICLVKWANMLKEWFFGREVELPKPLAQLSPVSPAHETPIVRTLLQDSLTLQDITTVHDTSSLGYQHKI